MQYVNSVFGTKCLVYQGKIHVKGSAAIFRLILCGKKIDSLQKQHTSSPLVTLALFVYMISKISTETGARPKLVHVFTVFSLDVMVN